MSGWPYSWASATNAARCKVSTSPASDEVAGRIMEAGLSSRVGYLGVVAPRVRQEARLTWLTDRNVGGLERIHGPAGLDIGARTPGEVAAAVLAEAIAVRRSEGQANP